MTLRFGTDGVRGIANRELTPELVLALGRAAARVLGTSTPFVIGRDTRRSGPMLEAALTAGLTAEGASVLPVGVLPTPGVAYLAAAESAAGAMVSASHNPYTDNGVKIFGVGGRKLDDDTQTRIEVELAAILAPEAHAEGGPVGAVVPVSEAATRYCAHLVSTVAAGTLQGLRVVVDCAHGAAAVVAPDALRLAGADVLVLNDTFDGTDINDGCGSTFPEGLQRAVLEHGADAGLALDGDADRVIAVDERGELVDGDQILAVAALDLRARGELRSNRIVVTVMSNLGLRRALAEHGIDLVETPVGDRHVLAALEEHDLALGGEQSGHVIFADLATTGDGTLTGMMLLDAMARSRRPLSELAGVVTRLPQVLRSVRVAGPVTGEPWGDATAAIAAELGDTGRVLVRPSGTEPVVRVMVEAPTVAEAEATADRLAAAVHDACSGIATAPSAPRS
jgi:phosphoglucosamine mutase